MKILSKKSVYGIQAALFVASQGKEQEYVPISRISDALGISFHFLTKILQTLSHHNIMVSYRGPNGGVALARPARDITLLEMINVIDNQWFDGCILGLPRCGEDVPCPLHASWSTARDHIKSMFEEESLEALGRRINKDGLRLSSGG